MRVILKTSLLMNCFERTEKRVFELAENGNSQEYVPIKQVVLNALDVIEKASKTKGKRHRNTDRVHRP